MLVTKVRELQQVEECIFDPLVSCLEAQWRARAIAPPQNLRSDKYKDILNSSRFV